MLILGAALLLAGCGSDAVKLTRADSGGQARIGAGGQFTIELPANPSTGYTWEPQDLDATMFELVDEPVFQAEGEQMPGAGGTLTLTFRALRPGTATLTLVYHRSWEPEVAPADTFSITVTVQ
jgi:inhibitor of cysteine peptidase